MVFCIRISKTTKGLKYEEVKSVGQVGEMRGSLGLVAEVNPNFSSLVLRVLILLHYCSALILIRLLICNPYFKSGFFSRLEKIASLL